MADLLWMERVLKIRKAVQLYTSGAPTPRSLVDQPSSRLRSPENTNRLGLPPLRRLSAAPHFFCG